MRKAVIIKISSLIVFLFCVICASKIIIYEVSLGGILRNISSETDHIPAYVVYGSTYVKDGKIEVSQLCRDQDEDNSWQQTFCIVDGSVYFLYTQRSNVYNWTIASIDLENLTFRNLYHFLNTDEVYNSNVYDEFDQRNGFYYDGQIILTDHSSVHVFDIEHNTSSIYDYDAYVFPKRETYGVCREKDTLALHFENSSTELTIEEMAQKSNGIAKIYSLREKKTWNGYSALATFLTTDRVQSIGDRIYTIETIIDYWGMPYIVILEFSRENSAWQYVTFCYVGDNTYEKCYLIPEVVDHQDGGRFSVLRTGESIAS